jgi:hypothetical protein
LYYYKIYFKEVFIYTSSIFNDTNIKEKKTLFFEKCYEFLISHEMLM